jgi:hypothetical protein
VSEIRSQLEGFELLGNTAAIIACDPEYVENGIYKAVCEALPFTVAGATTISQAVNGSFGFLMMSMLVLTSDDVFFEGGLTEDFSAGGADITERARCACEAAMAKLNGDPRIIFIFPPLIHENGGDQYVEAFDKLCPGTPLFGTIAISDTVEDTVFKRCYALYDGEYSPRAMSFIMVSGNVSPRFFATFTRDTEERLAPAEITKSDRNNIYEINGKPASEYFEEIGFAKNGKMRAGLMFVPMILDFKKLADYDGMPVVRAMTAIENDTGICQGYVYQNSEFTMAKPTGDDVMDSTAGLVDKIAAIPDKQATLAYSCMGRGMYLGMDQMREISAFADRLSDGAPFMMAYSGGEICPTSSTETKLANRFHNYTLIACVL